MTPTPEPRAAAPGRDDTTATSRDQATIDQQRQWMSSAHSHGCLFSAYLAERAGDSGWRSHVHHGDIHTAAKSFAEELRTAVESPDVELYSGLFPTVEGTGALVELLRALADQESFTVESALPWGLMTTVSISYRLDDQTSAWLMCFSSADCVPATRQSPCTELVIRAKPISAHPTRHRCVAEGDTAAVYVADTPTDLEEHAWVSAWRQTERNVARWLDGDEGRYAAARVSCVIPTTSWFGTEDTSSRFASLAAALENAEPVEITDAPWAGDPLWTTTAESTSVPSR